MADAVLDQVGRDGGLLDAELGEILPVVVGVCAGSTVTLDGQDRTAASDVAGQSTPRRGRHRRRGRRRRRRARHPARRGRRRPAPSAAPTCTCQNTPAETRNVTLATLVWTAPERCWATPVDDQPRRDAPATAACPATARADLSAARAVASGVDRDQRFTGVRRHDDLELVDPGPSASKAPGLHAPRRRRSGSGRPARVGVSGAGEIPRLPGRVDARGGRGCASPAHFRRAARVRPPRRARCRPPGGVVRRCAKP